MRERQFPFVYAVQPDDGVTLTPSLHVSIDVVFLGIGA